MNADLQYKIVPPATLTKILAGRKRTGETVVLCHGVFDIVHPGHIRHLLYAKSKADWLVASVTADRFVDKAKYRPFVPQDLRAWNLAVLEMVDYVVIDDNPTPLQLLGQLKPDYFAKGFEYQASGLATKTREELELVQSYGGEIIFTPGDVVYASSSLSQPDLKLDKLAMLMRTENLTFDGLQQTLASLRGISIHVVGDTIVDRLTHTVLLGASGKTPTLSVQKIKTEDFLGGAAIVAAHFAGAGAKPVALSTVFGNDDGTNEWVSAELARLGILDFHVTDLTRATTIKEAFVCDGHRLLKTDVVDNRSVSEGILTKLCGQVANAKTCGYVFSDFRHGIFNKHTIPEFVKAIPGGGCRIADSQVASRWGNILDFKEFDLICANEREARFALGEQDLGVLPLAEQLEQASKAAIVLKLGEHGCIGSGPVVLDSLAERVVDPVGAGDALLAYAGLAYVAGASMAEAVILGSVAAALECEAEGNLPITNEAVSQRLEEINKCVSGS